jgi:hypothetical protein
MLDWLSPCKAQQSRPSFSSHKTKTVNSANKYSSLMSFCFNNCAPDYQVPLFQFRTLGKSICKILVQRGTYMYYISVPYSNWAKLGRNNLQATFRRFRLSSKLKAPNTKSRNNFPPSVRNKATSHQEQCSTTSRSCEVESKTGAVEYQDTNLRIQ